MVYLLVRQRGRRLLGAESRQAFQNGLRVSDTFSGAGTLQLSTLVAVQRSHEFDFKKNSVSGNAGDQPVVNCGRVWTLRLLASKSTMYPPLLVPSGTHCIDKVKATFSAHLISTSRCRYLVLRQNLKQSLHGCGDGQANIHKGWAPRLSAPCVVVFSLPLWHLRIATQQRSRPSYSSNSLNSRLEGASSHETLSGAVER
jgi:hypothetical protein